MYLYLSVSVCTYVCAPVLTGFETCLSELGVRYQILRSPVGPVSCTNIVSLFTQFLRVDSAVVHKHASNCEVISIEEL